MKIKTIVVGYLETNCYILADDMGDATVVDPGANAEKILRVIDGAEARPQCVLLTHTHSDHLGALEGLRKIWNVPVLLSAEEADFLGVPGNRRKRYERGNLIQPIYHTISHEDIIETGDLEIKVLFTPGHTPGGVCYYFEDVLLSGDTLFMDGVGRTDFTGGDHDQLMASIKENLLGLPDSTRVYPGHGPSTTIGRERNYF